MKNKKILSIGLVVVLLALVFGTVAIFNKDKETASKTATTSVVKSSSPSAEKVEPTSLENATNVDLSKDPNLTITQPGTYEITGKTENGQITVNLATDTDEVVIVLNNAEIGNSTTAPIAILNGKEVTIETAEKTLNTISGTGNDSEKTATIYSKDDLKFTGSGTLVVTSANNNAIQSKNDLKFKSGTYDLTAKNEAIKGKDSVTFDGGTFTLNAESNAIKTTNIEEADQGVITVNAGTFDIKATSDGFHSATDIVINNGDIILEVEDDGMHADGTLTVNDGKITIENSYEGLEASDVQIKGGTIAIKAQDDGINGAGGNDTAATTQDRFGSSTGSIEISDGTITVAAGLSGSGDGIDSNGDLTITGGTITINDPSSARDWSPIDFDGNYSQSGATITQVSANGTKTAITEESAASQGGMKGGGLGGGMGGRGGR
ncbi:lipoprotein [Lactococcus hodotermopsidis]|uniref:Lipoprotein n=1 Tax=Pseudolactococcus hodotermopsidis TaxID=2709157 RepID=A0A6A0BBM0_9LACT|nr:carbohydrate-binding domain-containing protein [Lactococcus hodotermopsidis]GFH42236.1 lipoprotein [Lactococcus hodotermopsidis]